MSQRTSQTDLYASAVLGDVFALTGIGTVLFFSDIEGMIHVGDEMRLEDRMTKVIGIEMIRFADPSAHPADTIGLRIDDSEVDFYRPLIGQRAEFRKGG